MLWRVVRFPAFTTLAGLDLCNPRCVRFLIEPIVFVTEVDGHEQAGGPPMVHQSWGTFQQDRCFLHREPALVPQSLSPTLQFIGAAELIDHAQIELGSRAGMPALLVELAGDLTLSTFVQESVDFRNDFRLGLA